jgi:hypothetical protein
VVGDIAIASASVPEAGVAAEGTPVIDRTAAADGAAVTSPAAVEMDKAPTRTVARAVAQRRERSEFTATS